MCWCRTSCHASCPLQFSIDSCQPGGIVRGDSSQLIRSQPAGCCLRCSQCPISCVTPSAPWQHPHNPGLPVDSTNLQSPQLPVPSGVEHDILELEAGGGHDEAGQHLASGAAGHVTLLSQVSPQSGVTAPHTRLVRVTSRCLHRDHFTTSLQSSEELNT